MVEYIKIAVFFSIGVYIYERIDIAFALIFLLSLIMVLTVVSVFKHKFNTKILVMMTALVMGTVLCNAQVSENAHDLYKSSVVCARYRRTVKKMKMYDM